MPLLIFMAGCVTYYYPETALEDGVYYAEDDPSYILNSGDYSGVVYYPWSSLDYFYMGYWPYPRFGVVHGYPFGLGYSPWDYPNGFYGYYSSWYYSHYYGYYWQPYRGYCVRASACNRRHPGNRYASYYPDLHRNPGREDGEEYSPGEDGDIDRNSVSSTRYITTPPPGYSGNQGMVIRSNEGSKIGKNKLGPVKPVRSKPVSARSSTTGTVSRSPSASSMNTRAPRSSVVSRPSSRLSSGKSRTSSRRDRD